MMKFAFLGAAMMVSAPVLAQVTPAPAQTTPAAPQAAPATTADAAQTAQPAADASVSTQGQVQANGSQIAQVVDTQFPTYDKDGDGKLNKAEFAQWMVALKSQTDPSTKADAPATKKWVGSAFAQADTDKDKTVSKTELTGFLSQGQG
ncbi:EF-hand domain-containing protein [uncultured Sphingomonas sp.]|uniref:EF-hand domain-containing protein n=1 Tax=uncultured Sphingomonas sp. TaxID=158754 RepID=UPI0025F53F49|nr:EF-hand domain-containing protein [uncultured Sphingomonas sp.]